VIILVPFLLLRNSKLSFTKPFSCFCNRIRLVAEVAYLFRQQLPPHVAWPRYRRYRCPFLLFWEERSIFGWRPAWRGCLMRQTFCPALLLSLKSGRPRRCCVTYAYELLWSLRPGVNCSPPPPSYRLSLYRLRMDPTEHSLHCWRSLFTAQLSSNRHPIVEFYSVLWGYVYRPVAYTDIASTVSRWNVLTELLPSNALIKSVTIYFEQKL
jgi:hypothetical protein